MRVYCFVGKKNNAMPIIAIIGDLSATPRPTRKELTRIKGIVLE